MAKLSELKGLFDLARKASPKSRGAPSSAVKHARDAEASDPDVDLREVFADVKPLGARNQVRLAHTQPGTAPAQRIADEADALAASRYGAEPSLGDWEPGQEHEAEQTFLRKGLAQDLLAQLRRGRWAVQGELDLHRLTSEEARDALADFLNDARSNGWRCVRIVHGKGLSSPNREPVLKAKVRRWLTQRDEVLAYCEAPRHAGGSGAVLVLLKSRVA